MREFINGAEAIVRGAIDAGCDFFAGYPITPATPILLQMSSILPRVGGIAIQAEDEISALGFCIGAALTGARAMTATSGPGISLFSEHIGMAIMVEVPVVIVDCQRMGPSTGGATTGAQGDVQFLRWGTSGGYPVIVLAPTNVTDCYNLTLRAFDLAERFRTPVFLATDKDTVLNRTTVDKSEFDDAAVRDRNYAPTDVEYVPYRFDRPAEVPAMSSFGGPHLVRLTSSSHDERGYLIKDAPNIERINQHLSAKILESVDEISHVHLDLQEGAETVIISYGSASLAAAEAVEIARSLSVRVSALTVYSLWPVPEREIQSVLQGVKRVVVPEMNTGLYIREIERLARDHQEVIGVNRVDGGQITPFEILDRGGFQ
jgi:2-oxoglutarate ferredoxin oxidoreductase subunit alpha